MSFVVVGLVMLMKLRIRDLREDADLTQKEVTELLLCDWPLYSKYEREERPLPLETAIRLANLHRVTLDDLVGRSEKTGR